MAKVSALILKMARFVASSAFLVHPPITRVTDKSEHALSCDVMGGITRGICKFGQKGVEMTLS
jgi:hypothetical protein